MSAILDFPAIDESALAPITPATAVATKPAVDIALQDVDLQKIALAHFDAPRAALVAATEKLTDVVHDLSTAGKLADAKSLRNRLINIPLAEARKVSATLKSKLTAVSKAVGAELTSLESGFEAAENLITPQIEARDAEVAAEKAEREAKEAARVSVHRANIATIAGYVAQLQGKTSEQILAAINAIDAIVIDPAAWEEFAVGAEVQKAETLEALQALFDRTKTAEDEAAAREAQRIENERVAAELAEQKRVMAEKQAELDRKLAAIEAAEKAKVEAERAQAEALARQAAEDEANVIAAQHAAEAAAQRAAEESDAAAQQVQRELEVKVLGASTHAAIDAMFPGALAADPAVAAEVPMIPPPADMDAVSIAAWALPAGPVTFAESEPESVNDLSALLAHIDQAFEGRFSAHPKPTREWWGALRRLSDAARAPVAA
jgi:hypothetical protein